VPASRRIAFAVIQARTRCPRDAGLGTTKPPARGCPEDRVVDEAETEGSRDDVDSDKTLFGYHNISPFSSSIPD